MCRNIRTLHNYEPPATAEEIHASALQYVRKVSGSTKPSHANESAFNRAIEAVTAISNGQLATACVTSGPHGGLDVTRAGSCFAHLDQSAGVTNGSDPFVTP